MFLIDLPFEQPHERRLHRGEREHLVGDANRRTGKLPSNLTEPPRLVPASCPSLAAAFLLLCIPRRERVRKRARARHVFQPLRRRPIRIPFLGDRVVEKLGDDPKQYSVDGLGALAGARPLALRLDTDAFRLQPHFDSASGLFCYWHTVAYLNLSHRVGHSRLNA